MITFPIAVIDFEATSLTLESYPIEVGVARVASTTSTINTWSKLIAPDPAWQMDAQWDLDAERVHGISRWQLQQGERATAVMAALNEATAGATLVLCDGGHYDVLWLNALSSAAAMAPAFRLTQIDSLFAEHPNTQQRYSETLRRSVPPHRAGPDATRICHALRMAFHPEDDRRSA